MAGGSGFNDDFFNHAMSRARSPIADFLQSATPQTGHVDLGGMPQTGRVDFGWEPVRRTGVDLSPSGYASSKGNVDLGGVSEFLRPLQLIQEGTAKAAASVAAAKKAQGQTQQQQAPPKPGQPAAPAKMQQNVVGTVPAAGLEGISLSGLGPGNRQEFWKRAMALGQVLEQETGIPAELLAAMAANESNFGNAPGNILGGVKALPGEPSVELNTTEVINGVRVPVRDRFRASATAIEGMRHVARTLQRGNYAQAYEQLRQGQISPENFIFQVNRAGYATNPNWATGEIIPLMSEAGQYREAGNQIIQGIEADHARRADALSTASAEGNQSVIEAARQWTGTPYRLGGNGQGGIDCSALILRAAESVGRPLPRGIRTAQQIHDVSVPVDPKDVQPGDLIFFTGTYAGNPGEVDTHVGIVSGPGSMISASSGGVGTQNYQSGYWAPKITGYARLR